MKYNINTMRVEHTVKGVRVPSLVFRFGNTRHCCTSIQLGDFWTSLRGKDAVRCVKLATKYILNNKVRLYNGWEPGLLHVELVREEYIEAFIGAGWKLVTEYWSPGHDQRVVQLQYINPEYDKYNRNV